MLDEQMRSLERKENRSLGENLTLANHYWQKGMREEAMGFYQLVLEEDPGCEEAIPRACPIIRRLPVYPIRQATDFGQQYGSLAPRSIALAEDMAQLQRYSLNQFYSADKAEREATECRFDHEGYGEVTNDACDYNNGDKKMRRVKPTDRRVLWIQKVLGFRRRGIGWQAITGPDSQEYKILVPASGLMELTDDGLCRPDTGTPFSTIPDRDKYGNQLPEKRQMEMAIESWTRRGYRFSIILFFMSRKEKEGTAIVGRYSIPEYHFIIDAEGEPDDIHYSFIGAVYPG